MAWRKLLTPTEEQRYYAEGIERLRKPMTLRSNSYLGTFTTRPAPRKRLLAMTPREWRFNAYRRR